MRMTVEQLIAELKTCDPKADVQFRRTSNVNGELENHVQRIDNFGHVVHVVVEKGV